MSILWGVKNDSSQGFPLTKLMAVNTGLARLRHLRCQLSAITHNWRCFWHLLILLLVWTLHGQLLHLIVSQFSKSNQIKCDFNMSCQTATWHKINRLIRCKKWQCLSVYSVSCLHWWYMHTQECCRRWSSFSPLPHWRHKLQTISLTFFRYLKWRCHGNQFCGKIVAKLPTPPALITLSFRNGTGYRYLNVRINSINNSYIVRKFREIRSSNFRVDRAYLWTSDTTRPENWCI